MAEKLRQTEIYRDISQYIAESSIWDYIVKEFNEMKEKFEEAFRYA